MNNKQNIKIDRDAIKQKFKIFLKNVKRNKKTLAFSDEDDLDYVNNDLFIELKSNYKNYYKNFEELGQGTLGIVKKAKSLKDDKYYAVKIIRSIDDEVIFQIKNEFKHLYKISHENIIKVYQLLIDTEKCKIYWIMEYYESIELLDYITKIENYDEKITKNIFNQLLKGIDFLHNNGIVHRDLKPNNILISEKTLKLKITDFNIAKFTDIYNNYESIKKDNIQMITYTGTISYNAPEIFSKGLYTELVDLWSAGCILYLLLIGKQPFQKIFVKDLIEQIKNNGYDKKCKEWFLLTKKAKSLIEGLLVIDTEKRLNSKEALDHPWFNCEIVMNLNYCSNSIILSKNSFNKSSVNDFKAKKNKTDSFIDYIRKKTIQFDNSLKTKNTIKKKLVN